MNSFPDSINVKNKNLFKDINDERIISLFRKEIYETLISRKDENNYIDLDIFSKKYCNNKIDSVKKFLDKIINELNNLGWKTKLSYGDTGLFIFSTEDPPSLCW